MKVEWFRGTATDVEKQERRELVKAARPTLEILRKALEARLAEREAKETSLKLYESPSWAYMQADLTGSKRELKELIDLLTLED